MADRLDSYRRKRDAARTPEPIPDGPLPAGGNDTFVIQQHHARSLHWDLRLERDGVLVSWAVPRGIPREPARDHLAKHTEDHPLEYAGFSGEIPAGEYGGGRMTIYDRGTYTTEKWQDDKVVMVLHGSRVEGRYALYRTRGDDWMIHRMDPIDPSWTPRPRHVRPMTAATGADLPFGDEWAYELKWAGVRALGSVYGGRLLLADADDVDVTQRYREIRKLGEELAPVECLLDGVVVEFGRTPVYLLFDLLWIDGESLVDRPYRDRRDILDGRGLAGPHWQTPPYFPGGAAHAVAASRAQGGGGVVAKRLDSGYRSGPSADEWIAVDPAPDYAEVTVVGWRDDALLLADQDGRYMGQVSVPQAALTRLARLARKTPAVDAVPIAVQHGAHWITPRFVGEVTHDGYTADGRLRRPRWRGYR
jgi:bifunctional non-homologous end joining protein LigD